jgi:hypothetical protein
VPLRVSGAEAILGRVKNCKEVEELATSSCNLAATKIAPRNPHEAKKSNFYDIINFQLHEKCNTIA